MKKKKKKKKHMRNIITDSDKQPILIKTSLLCCQKKHLFVEIFKTKRETRPTHTAKHITQTQLLGGSLIGVRKMRL